MLKPHGQVLTLMLIWIKNNYDGIKAPKWQMKIVTALNFQKLHWRDGLMVKSIGYRPRFNTQPTQSNQQPSVTPVPGDPMPSSGLYTCGAHTYIQKKTPIYKIKTILKTWSSSSYYRSSESLGQSAELWWGCPAPLSGSGEHWVPASRRNSQYYKIKFAANIF